MSDDGIELDAAAAELGVHYQTAYRWVRAGRLPATLVRGRYRISRAALQAFATRRDRPQTPAPRRPRAGLGGLAEKVFEHLVAGSEREARAVVAGLVDSGVAFTTVMQEVLAPALRRIGAEWMGGRLSIAEEHRAAAIVERIIGGQHPTPRGRRRGVAVVAAMAGDHHVLPTSMAAAALREDNWQVHHLGADVPADDLVRFCVDAPVDLAVLTVTNTDATAAAEHVAERLEHAGVRALVGAPGGTLDGLQQMARRRRAVSR